MNGYQKTLNINELDSIKENEDEENKENNIKEGKEELFKNGVNSIGEEGDYQRFLFDKNFKDKFKEIHELLFLSKRRVDFEEVHYFLENLMTFKYDDIDIPDSFSNLDNDTSINYKGCHGEISDISYKDALKDYNWENDHETQLAQLCYFGFIPLCGGLIKKKFIKNYYLLAFINSNNFNKMNLENILLNIIERNISRELVFSLFSKIFGFKASKNGDSYIMFKFLNKGNLKKSSDNENTYQLLMRQLLFLKLLKVIHGDIKHANILLTKTGPILIDLDNIFGQLYFLNNKSDQFYYNSLIVKISKTINKDRDSLILRVMFRSSRTHKSREILDVILKSINEVLHEITLTENIYLMDLRSIYYNSHYLKS